MDYCASSPCKNGGTCMNLLGSFSCNCTAEYTGTYCEIPIDKRKKYFLNYINLIIIV